MRNFNLRLLFMNEKNETTTRTTTTKKKKKKKIRTTRFSSSRLNLIFVLFYLAVRSIQSSNAIKINLFDSSKIKEDLNWSKISFKETPSQTSSSLANNGPAWLKDKLASSLDTNNQIYGWKESSFSLFGGDDVWRIYFVCDLNVQNIQNWLFTPLINTRQANRVTLNLTFTIRECEQFPIKQVVKNCREKFELYYEELDGESGDMMNVQKSGAAFGQESTEKKTADISTTSDGGDSNETVYYFLNKIKQLRFRDTFVSDTGLRYYNSVVDRQQQLNRYVNNRGTSSGTGSTSGDSSSINVELREIPLNPNKNHNGNSFIRFAIRDTGACISLLSVEVSYVTCSAFTKHGVSFPETSTGRDLTDLIQVSGKCPLFTSSSQTPKAICTAKGEWLITDQNLSNRCLCLPGYEFTDDKCTPCRVGFYKNLNSNEQKCLPCPEKSWSIKSGSEKCECLNEFYRENEFNYTSGCKAIQKITIKNVNVGFIDEEKINISINRHNLDPNVKLNIKCHLCNLQTEECNTICSILSISKDWIIIQNKNIDTSTKKLKLIVEQISNERLLSNTYMFININQIKHVKTGTKQNSILATMLAAHNDEIANNNNVNGESTDQTKESDLVGKDLDTATDGGVNCEMYQNLEPTLINSSPLCLNMSIDLNYELEKLYARFDLIDRIKRAQHAQMRVYALLINNNNDYQLIPTENNQFKSNYYVQLRLLDSANLKTLIWNNSHLPILICNLFEIESIKIEINFKPGYDDYDQELNDSIDLFTIEIKLSEHCTKREITNKPNQLITSLLSTKETNTQRLEFNAANVASAASAASNNSTHNVKVHVILPIVLSFFFVFVFILIAVFFRRMRMSSSKSKRTEYNCEKHIRRFMPILRRNSSTKCINCGNGSANSSSSSSSTSSTSPSTTCTTSQIIERNSKLYYVDPHTYEDPALAIQEFAQEISPLDIKIESVIGGGEFGDVCKGKLRSLNNHWTTVAIKTLKVGSSEKSRCDFLTEASIMAQFHHENIISLEGVVTQSHPYMIITEYMDNGSLDTFLRLNSWRLDIYDLVKMLRDIANGMKYLSEMNFVHRDLAARNILVNKDLKCKVADFGLSREIEGNTTEGVYWTKGGKIPVRWTAPEAISHTKFTCSSDVWSFGIVAWEVMSYGERPYWNWSNTDVIKAVEKGFRLLIPANCPQVLYNMMLDCWEADRLRRPKFKQITCDLEILIKSKKECLYTTSKHSKQIAYIDTNRPNFAQLTSIHEWLNSLNLIQYHNMFLSKRYLNLSQVLTADKNDLLAIEIWDETHQKILLESLKCIQFELNFQNGFLV